MLHATMILAHSHLDMDSANSGRLTNALATVFGSDQRAQVIGNSSLFDEQPLIWEQRVCFGSLHKGYSVLCWRDRSDRLQASVEMTADVRFQDACSSVHSGLRRALSRQLGIRPRLESLDVLPLGDTKPVLIGKTGFLAHVEQRATLEPVIFAIIAAVVVGLGSWLWWGDQAASLWSGASAVFAVGAWGAVVAILSGLSRKIRWLPAS